MANFVHPPPFPPLTAPVEILQAYVDESFTRLQLLAAESDNLFFLHTVGPVLAAVDLSPFEKTRVLALNLERLEHFAEHHNGFYSSLDYFRVEFDELFHVVARLRHQVGEEGVRRRKKKEEKYMTVLFPKGVLTKVCIFYVCVCVCV